MTVLELLQEFEKVSDRKVPYESKARREGDIVAMFADASLAKKELGWHTKYTLKDMCKLN